MSSNSTIEWTDSTWNPITGCDKISPGCGHCYAETFAERFRGVKGHPFEQGFDLKLWHERLELPLGWKKPRVIFVNSMSDLFHKDIPTEYILKVFTTMRLAYWHTFQILTKRSQRLLEMDSLISWQPNIWMGVSVENQKYTHRIDDLRKTHAQIKFLSLEPLLGALPNLNLREIDWAIVGGESGPRARPMQEEWVIDIRNQCKQSGVPFFFKQWGGVQKKKNGRELEGRTWDEMPVTVAA